jgi:hypothetical protein
MDDETPVLVINSLTQATLSSVLAVDGCPKHPASSTEVSPFFNFANHLEVCVLPIACSQNVVLSTGCVLEIFFQVCNKT